MTPEYLEQLANLADPNELWRTGLFERKDLSQEQQDQMNMGIALRRHASHVRTLQELLVIGKSLVITPISKNGVATRTIPIPDYHQFARDPAPSKVFDVLAFYEALKKAVGHHKSDWACLSKATGVSPKTLYLLSCGRKPDVASLAALSGWAGLDPERYMKPVVPQPEEKPA